MKRFFETLVLLYMVVALTSCNEIDVSEHESNNHGFSSNHLGTFADSVTGEGIYLFPNMGGYDSLLHYWNIETDEYTVLCGKADCDHDTADCNGYFYTAYSYTLQVYDEKIYVWGQEEKNYNMILFQMELDGSNRRKIYELSYALGVPQYSIVYEGDCYVVMGSGQTNQGMNIEQLYRLSLTSEKEPELIHESDVDSNWIDDSIWDFFAYDDGVFFRQRQSKADEQHVRYYRYDITTRELNMVYENAQMVSCIMIEGKLYATVRTEDTYEIYCINPENGITEAVFEHGGTFLTYDGTYLYSCRFDHIYVYRLDGTLVDTFECRIEIRDALLPFTTQNYICFYRMAPEMEYNVFSKKEIGSTVHSVREWIYDDGKSGQIGY